MYLPFFAIQPAFYTIEIDILKYFFEILDSCLLIRIHFGFTLVNQKPQHSFELFTQKNFLNKMTLEEDLNWFWCCYCEIQEHVITNTLNTWKFDDREFAFSYIKQNLENHLNDPFSESS